MRAVIQRVKRAKVTVNGKTTGEIGPGLLILLGVKRGDTEEAGKRLAEKCVHLRIFEDESGKFNRSLRDTGGEVLVVSQFTLYGDCSRGRRPGFSEAAPPEEAESLYRKFVDHVADLNITVATGRFGAHMDVELCNDGPVTLIMEMDAS